MHLNINMSDEHTLFVHMTSSNHIHLLTLKQASSKTLDLDVIDYILLSYLQLFITVYSETVKQNGGTEGG